MKVIGLSPLDKDSTVTVVEDGEITYAAAEERFTRVKLQDGFPWRALADALQATGTTPADVQCVVYPFLGWQEETRLFERNLANERDFLDDAESPETSARIEAAREPGAAPDWRDSRPPRSQRADGQRARENARLQVSRQRKRGVAERGEERLGPMGPRRVGVSPQMA